MFVVGGESLIDLISEPVGADGTIRLVAHQGGSPYNCAIALSKLGNDTGFLCPISQDGLGTYLMGPLAAVGVKPLLAERVAAPTTLAVVTYDDKRNANYGFYRSADRAFTREGLLKALPEKLDVFQVGGFCPIKPEDAEVWLAVATEAMKRGAALSMDPNVRPSLVDDFAGYVRRLNSFLDIVQLVKVSIEDLVALKTNGQAKSLSEAEEDRLVEDYVADFLSRPRLELVMVTYGERGSRAFTKSARAEQGVHAAEPFGDTVGAGDSLMAGVLTQAQEWGALKPGGLAALSAEKLTQLLRFGAVVAGLNCRHVGCVPPSRAEVDAVLRG
jgi:fructokinase